MNTTLCMLMCRIASENVQMVFMGVLDFVFHFVPTCLLP